MYLRRTTRRVGGKTYQNYLLVESVATPKGPRQRVLCSLGALAPGPKDAWLGTARRLHAALAGHVAELRKAREFGPTTVITTSAAWRGGSCG
jgi:hypothetical protein